MRYVFGEWTLDTQRSELSRAGRVIRLRRKVCQVLAYLLAQADRVVSKQELCEQVWAQQFISDTALESTIKAVRQALGDSGRHQQFIQTVYGQGYRFVADVVLCPATPLPPQDQGAAALLVSPAEPQGGLASPRGGRREGRRVHHPLPLPLTSFIGRERETAAVKRLLAATRLLTLTGPGGCGKTRLALHIAADLVDTYRDGVWVVELASLWDPALLPHTVAGALGVGEDASQPLLATLTAALRARQLLLVLDNCEHLVAVCAVLVDTLLRACPALQILATSREVLGMAGETVWRVPPLATPNPQCALSLECLLHYEAVRLFMERATAVLPSFMLTPQQAPWVVQICQRLDGLPLAIELAATRVKVLSVAQIAARLEDQSRLLTGGSRTALPRQQTLQATLDWSYALLSEPEQVLFRRLAVFAGGWTVEAAECVCAGPAVEPSTVLELLASLVDKSLVLVDEQAGQARYRLLETLRQYGVEKLREGGETAVVRRRHRDWYMGLAEQAAPRIWGAEQGPWLARLDTEAANLWTALTWSTEQDETEAVFRFVGALWRFWSMRGYWSEGQQWIQAAMAGGSAAVSPSVRARALYGLGLLAADQSDYTAARTLLEESLTLCRALGERYTPALTLSNLGSVAFWQGDYALACTLLEESLALCRAGAHQGGMAYALASLGLVRACQGEPAVARGLLEASLTCYHALGDQRGRALALNYLGIVAAWQEDYASAHAFHEKSLALHRALGDTRGMAVSLRGLGCVAASQEHYALACTLYRESLMHYRVIGHKRGMVECLEGVAKIASAEGQSEWAARLYGAAEALRETLGSPVLAAERPFYDRAVATLRAACGEETCATAWAAGRVMMLEQAIGSVLEPSCSSMA